MLCGMRRLCSPVHVLATLAVASMACTSNPVLPADAAVPDARPTADAGAPDDASPMPGPVRLMLHGGGAEDDAIFAKFVEAAGYGHIVTLGAVEDPGSYPDLLFWDGYFTGLGAASAETINTESRGDASLPAVATALAAADGVFIRGGDQSRYLDHWQGTVLQTELIAAYDRGAIVGGSSAGAMILGRPLYDARVAGVAAWEALIYATPSLVGEEPYSLEL